MEIKGWVYVKPGTEPWEHGQPKYTFWEVCADDGGPSKYWIEDGYTPVCPHTITFEPIDQKAMVEGAVNSLLARKEKLEAEHKREVAKIDDAIANLRCLEFSPSA